jgi:hypothetical protein
MRKVSEYEEHAADCRAMAKRANDPVQKKQLEEMADTWAMLANERRKQLIKQMTEQRETGRLVAAVPSSSD